MATPNVDQSVALLIEKGAPCDDCRQLILGTGAICYVADSLQAAKETLAQVVPDVIVVNYDTLDRGGIEVIAALRREARHRAPPIILLTGEIDARELERAVMIGIYAFLAKPFPREDFLQLVQAAIAQSAEQVSNRDS